MVENVLKDQHQTNVDLDLNENSGRLMDLAQEIDCLDWQICITLFTPQFKGNKKWFESVARLR